MHSEVRYIHNRSWHSPLCDLQLCTSPLWSQMFALVPRCLLASALLHSSLWCPCPCGCCAAFSLTDSVMMPYGWGPLGLWVAVHRSLHTASECQSAGPLRGLSSHLSPTVFCEGACLYTAMCTCVIVFLVCHFLGRFGEAHGAGGGTWRPWPGGSCCHSGRGQSRCRGEVRGVWLQCSTQWPYLPGQKHSWLQT